MNLAFGCSVIQLYIRLLSTERSWSKSMRGTKDMFPLPDQKKSSTFTHRHTISFTCAPSSYCITVAAVVTENFQVL